ncbi:nucleoside-triphosphatase THEP1 [Peribacillus deserti]|uniref:Nucleoside-triphosphatase THEP1 n=1 Tax=Peribacillus deserti TaxID=673318 RepID=A0ABS2QDH4_9BACI|nr:AAA domain-containing protein [Peribacillus deserti]MBM7691203.1 nucleoside-triphosphatase THEP1 [Peribacillus deserti]
MISTRKYISEWQNALRAEIFHLKKYGSTKYFVKNGRLLSGGGEYTYYFDSSDFLRIPSGSVLRLEWGSMSEEGRLLSSEGKSAIISFTKSMGDLIDEAFLYYDPWKLLDELSSRFDEMKESKQKRSRIKHLMNPDVTAKHPTDKIKNNLHELILRSKYNPATFVWGPPGTGKTYTLARVAANKYSKNLRVLILSHSNQAVDVLMAEISSFLKKKDKFKEGDILRYGSNANENLDESITVQNLLEKRHPSLAEKRVQLLEERKGLKQDLSGSFSQRDSSRLLDLETKIASVLEKVRVKELQFVKDAEIIGTTLAKAASDPAVYERTYDIVIVDEISQAYIPQAAFAATLGKRIIVCGDFMQLPPIASSRHPLVEKWLKTDIYQEAGVTAGVREGKLHAQLFLLDKQRRMHPDISAFTNKFIYQSLVSDYEGVRDSREKNTGLAPFPGKASVLLDSSFSGEHCITDRISSSRMNLWHVFLSFQAIHEAYTAGARSLGYVTPYRAQAALMGVLLEDLYKEEQSRADIIAATVHRFQGSEREQMIFDTVDTWPQSRPGMLVIGKDSERLINVAVTRSKSKFIHVSDMQFLRSTVYGSKTIRQLSNYQDEHGHTVSQQDIGKWIVHQNPKMQWFHARNLEQVKKDVAGAGSSMIFSLPAGSTLTQEWADIIKSKGSRVKTTVISKDGSHLISDADHYLAYDIPFPCIIIDQRYLWYGMPVEGAKRIKPPSAAVRLESPAFIQHLLSVLPAH